MFGLLEFFPFQTGHASLSVCRVQLFQLFSGELFDMSPNEVDTLIIVGHIRSMSFQPDHVECGGRFQGSMEMEIFSWILGFIQIGRQPTIHV